MTDDGGRRREEIGERGPHVKTVQFSLVNLDGLVESPNLYF